MGAVETPMASSQAENSGILESRMACRLLGVRRHGNRDAQIPCQPPMGIRVFRDPDCGIQRGPLYRYGRERGEKGDPKSTILEAIGVQSQVGIPYHTIRVAVGYFSRLSQVEVPYHTIRVAVGYFSMIPNMGTARLGPDSDVR